jgi:hypothetical protein
MRRTASGPHYQGYIHLATLQHLCDSVANFTVSDHYRVIERTYQLTTGIWEPRLKTPSVPAAATFDTDLHLIVRGPIGHL